MKIIKQIIKFFKDWDKPVELKEGERHCYQCDGYGWVGHQNGDCRCGKCNGEGKIN